MWQHADVFDTLGRSYGSATRMGDPTAQNMPVNAYGYGGDDTIAPVNGRISLGILGVGILTLMAYYVYTRR